MKAYRFATNVSEQGTIQVPYNPALFEGEVEVVILPKSKSLKDKMKASQFIKKWGGFLTDNDTDRAKHDYLSEKYK